MRLSKLALTALGSGALVFAMSLTPSEQGTDIIQKHEGLRTAAYLDPVGIPTICYGSTSGVKLGQVATKDECYRKYVQDSTRAAEDVRRLVVHPITQGQFDALVSFVFNVGVGNFRSSTLLKRINAGECLAAGQEFPRWNKATDKRTGKKVVLPGLTTRRADERSLWEEGCYLWK